MFEANWWGANLYGKQTGGLKVVGIKAEYLKNAIDDAWFKHLALILLTYLFLFL